MVEKGVEIVGRERVMREGMGNYLVSGVKYYCLLCVCVLGFFNFLFKTQ
jgi:hypothetical protein